MQKKDWLKLIDIMAADEGNCLTIEDKYQALDMAVIRYSTDRPRTEAADVTTTDGYTIPLPSMWQDNFSRVLGIEVPVGLMPPSMLTSDSWMPHRIPGQDVILLVRPEAINTLLRVHFTLPHIITEDEDTIPDKDREAVGHWAASILLDSLSGIYAGNMQSTINSDSVDHAGKMPNYKSLADGHRQQYLNHIGIDPKRTVSAGVVVAIGERRLLHRGPRNRIRT